MNSPRSAPTLPPGIRSFRAGDEDPVLAVLLAAHGRGELEGVTRHELERSVERFVADPALCAVAEDEGRVAGWIAPIHDDLTVDLPFRRRGHGTRLIAAGRALAAELGYPALRLWVPPLPGPTAFARSAGLRYHASLWLLRLDAGAPVVPPRFPDEVVVRWLEPGVDEPAFVELVNSSFLDHPWPLRLDVRDARAAHGRPEFDPSTILLVATATDRERLIAFCRVSAHADDDGRAVGDVRLVGVRPEARGRGLGRELVRWGIEDLVRRGTETIVLSVESENVGALRLYESLGFRPEVEWPHWVTPLHG